MSKNSSAKYYQENKERLQKKFFLKKKKKNNSSIGHERYKNLPEDEKQKLFEYRKQYYKMRKNALL